MPFACFSQTSWPCWVALPKAKVLLYDFHSSWQNAGGKVAQGLGVCSPHAVSPRPIWATACVSQPTLWCMPVCRLGQSTASLVSLHYLLALKQQIPLSERGHKPGVSLGELSYSHLV